MVTFQYIMSSRRHKRRLRKYVESGSKGTPATRVLALLVESGVVYAVLWVYLGPASNIATTKLNDLQVVNVILNFAPSLQGLSSELAGGVIDTFLVCPVPLVLSCYDAN
jgi:hypothetical protein